ncbi:hypothetical protein O9A_00013 [Bartonella koehlerae C-29]|uniref:Uncharacterized protein n=1 Tax=Bartonella koehlerae C-29 TaxID=1134510 RepID=A0A067W9P3_9HYPH|nr:hypothetical protein O9A_00013 [Bartonella koehlerae C-29]
MSTISFYDGACEGGIVKAIVNHPLCTYEGENRHHHSLCQLKMLHQPSALEMVHKEYFYSFLEEFSSTCEPRS